MNIINNCNLSQQYITLLSNCASKPFYLGNFQSIDDILTRLNVNVFIVPGIVTRTIPNELLAAEQYWIEEANRLESMIPDAEDKDSAFEDYHKARDIRDDIHRDIEEWSVMPLRGLYEPKQKAIKLYPDEMQQEYNGNRMNELLVSTLAHETMHAYFNRPDHDEFSYVIHVEEPLAEFGMLLYLHETSSSYYNWAYQDVSNKMTCYRYGAILMNQHLNQGPNSSIRQNLEDYKVKLNGYPMLTHNSDAGQIILAKKDGRSATPNRKQRKIMNNKEKTVIYIFGPKRLSEDYYKGKQLTIDNGGWLKIGLTTCDFDQDAWQASMKRINQEVKTGIAETCRLLDVFEYPLLTGKADDRIRNILTTGLYTLENSKANNKQIVDLYEIKAGNEYVYGVKRENVLYTIQVFERQLLDEFHDTVRESDFFKCLERNKSAYESDEYSQNGNEPSKSSAGNEECDKFWDKVLLKLPEKYRNVAHRSAGRPYINFGLLTSSFGINAVFSTRKNEAAVALNGPKVGLPGKQKVTQYIQDKGIQLHIQAIQGTKNQARWYWPETTTYAQNEDILVDWFADRIQIFYDNFEELVN